MKNQTITPQINAALQASITPVGIEFNRNHLILGENYCRIYGIISYPSECDYGWLSKISNIAGTIVSINHAPLDNGTLMSTVSKNISSNRGAELSAKDALERQRRARAADDAEKMLTQVEYYNEVIAAFDITIMVLSRDKEDFADKCTRVENITNSQNCRVRILSNLQKEGYQQLSPTYPQISKVSDITSRPFPVSTFVGGFPFAASGFNDGSGYYLGKDGNGGIIMFDLWKRGKSRTNSNITIVGSPGTGKSTAIKHLITSEYARGTKIIVIDPEGEYKEMCRNPLFSGSWIDAAGGRGGLINPLQIRPSPPDDDDDKTTGMGDMAVHIKTLNTFFQLYIPSLTDTLNSILEDCLIELYAKHGITWDTDISKLKNNQFPTFSHLYNLVLERCKTDTANIEHYNMLKTYLNSVAKGADKGLWNGYTTLAPNTNFIVLDTKALMNMGGHILSAQYYNILTWCWEVMSRNPKERVMLVADECWIMIDPRVPQSLQFLRNVEKRARKYEGSVVVGTQSIVDFLDPSVKMYGQSVLDLPSIKLLFGSDGQSLEETRNLFHLNDAQYDLIASKQRGLALMKIGSQAVKVRFEFSDARLALFGKGGGR